MGVLYLFLNLGGAGDEEFREVNLDGSLHRYIRMFCAFASHFLRNHATETLTDLWIGISRYLFLLKRPLSIVDKALETEMGLRHQETRIPDPVSGLTVARLYQFAGDLCVEARDGRNPGPAGCVLGC